MAHASLRFASDILRRLGEELNPNADQGIVELAKNSYDADALTCTITLHDVTSPGGTIIVSDDGDGMTGEDIRDGWLVLGRSRKDVTQRTARGRIPAGNKGLGRLAALRLGSEVSLRTRPASEPTRSYRLEIDWEDFDEEHLVEDVELEIQRRRRPPGAANGTELTIGGLRQPLGRMDVKRLARSLILLADPFSDDPEGFRPVLEAPEYEDLAALVSRRYFDDADYHLIAEIDEEGLASGRVVDWRGNELFVADHAELRRKRADERFSLPPVTFDLWAFVLTREAFAPRAVSVSEVREWLGQFGGVHLYINGLRVAPYGNPGNDWLDMNVRRARSPEERPSTNTALGRIAITDEEGALAQKTDRSGLIEDEQFLQLRTFASEALDWMARRRMEVAERRRAAERSASESDTSQTRQSVQEQIEELPTEHRAAMQRSFRRYDKARDRREATLSKELQLYRTLATAGITAATFAHESAGNPLKIITQATRAIERRGKQALDGDYAKKFGAPVDALRNATQTLGVLSSVTLGLVSSERRRPGRVELHPVIRRTVRTFQPFTEGRDVEVELRLSGRSPYLRATEAAIESIVANLLNNALAAFEQADTPQRRIEITSEILDSTFVLTVADNGPGIEGIELKDIWLPGESGREGTGLGLTIVRDAITDLGGSVEAVAHGDLGGAEFSIELPILGVR
jgi:C4-dicarboxylate-specific signal transduction histidine kinase